MEIEESESTTVEELAAVCQRVTETYGPDILAEVYMPKTRETFVVSEGHVIDQDTMWLVCAHSSKYWS